MAWNPDPEPLNKKEILITLATIVGCGVGCYLLKDINLFIALLLGSATFYGIWLLFGDLCCIFKNVQYSPYAETRERQQSKILKIVAILCLVVPTICLIIGIILAIITVNNR